MSIYRRALVLLSELKAGKYPNAHSFAAQVGCSRNTAQRTIYRLRDEYLVPIEYDQSRKGYYLSDPRYELPQQLPPGKDELTALLLAREVVRNLDAADLTRSLDELWAQFSANNSSVSRELEPVARCFSCDTTQVGDIVDFGVLEFVSLAAAGESVELTYQSPWRHTEPRIHRGRVASVHYSDGNLYLLFYSESGKEFVLNAAFIKNVRVLEEPVQIRRHDGDEPIGSENFRRGFGVWAGRELDDIEIHILPPASKFYASQRWHEEQEDFWEGEILVRRMRAIVSPELTRRVLGLGHFIGEVKPESLKASVLENARGMLKNLDS